MRTPTIRRLIVGAGVCLAVAAIVWLPGRTQPKPTPLVGGAPAGPFPTGSAGARTPAPVPATPEPPGSPTPTASASPTASPSATRRVTPSSSRMPSATAAPTSAVPRPRGNLETTAAPEPTSTPTDPTASESPTPTPSATASPTPSPTSSASPSASPSPTPTRDADFPYSSVPTLSVPVLDDVCNTDQTSFTVTWTAISGVDHYHVTTSQLGGPFTTSGNSQQISCPTGAGSFTITVVGRNAAGDKETETSQVTATYSPPLGGPDYRVALTTR